MSIKFGVDIIFWTGSYGYSIWLLGGTNSTRFGESCWYTCQRL